MIVQYIFPCELLPPELPLLTAPGSTVQFNSVGPIDIGAFRLNGYSSHDQKEGAVYFIAAMSSNDAILSKVQIVHRLIDNFFDPFPVAAPLYKLVNVLRKQISF